MRNRIPITVAAFAVVTAACGSTGEVVATVDGEIITFDQVLGLMSVEGDTVDNAVFLGMLRAVIADYAIVSTADSHFGLTRSQAEIDTTFEEIVGPLTEGGVSQADILVANNLTEEGLRAIAAQRVLQEKVEAALVSALDAPSDEVLRQRYDAVLASEANVCSSHILLESQEDAEAALDRARVGEDFATLAMELSTGPSGPSGGDLGCGAPSQFVAEFSIATLQAEVGVPFGPVQSSFGWHVILVSERSAPTFEELRDQIIESIASEQEVELWTAWLVAALEEADVAVEPEYGTWTTNPVPSIIPPAP